MWGCAVLAGLLVLCSLIAAVPGLCMITWSCVVFFFSGEKEACQHFWNCSGFRKNIPISLY